MVQNSERALDQITESKEVIMSGKKTVCIFGLMWCVALAAGAVIVTPEDPQPEWRETQWSAHLAQRMGAESEVILPDRSRADIMTETTAYEVEWSDKKGESVYQALSYMLEGNKESAGIILLCRGDWQKDRLQLARVVAYLQGHGVPIRMETIKAD